MCDNKGDREGDDEADEGDEDEEDDKECLPLNVVFPELDLLAPLVDDPLVILEGLGISSKHLDDERGDEEGDDKVADERLSFTLSGPIRCSMLKGCLVVVNEIPEVVELI